MILLFVSSQVITLVQSRCITVLSKHIQTCAKVYKLSAINSAVHASLVQNSAETSNDIIAGYGRERFSENIFLFTA